MPTLTASILLVSLSLTLSLHAAPPNTLTPAEVDSGWVLLFDGKSLHGWHAKGDTTATTTKWTVDDSAIHLPRNRKAGHIYSPLRAESFELKVDWKIDNDNANSGIWMRMLEHLSEDVRSGPEIQIIGKKSSDYANPKLTCGSHYMMYGPDPLPDAWLKPVGQWNSFRVVMDGKKVEHWANGVRIVSFEIGTADWLERQKAAAARIQNAYYGGVHYGNFVLTDHDWPVWYRNFKVRPLSGTVLKPAFKGYTVSLAPRRGLAPAGPRSSPVRAIFTLDGRSPAAPAAGLPAAGLYLLRGK